MNTKTLFFTTALVCFASIATANDTYYLPSDSFFYFRPNIGELNSFAETESPTVPYGSHWNAGFGCGHIGYKDLMLKNLSAESKAALIQAFKQLKPKVDADEKLGGRMSVFVYSKEYDWKRFEIALQYNESWVDESVSFGANREHVRLESFVQNPTSIMQNWRDSNLVQSLGADCPKLPEGHKQAWTKTPAAVDSDKVAFLIIAARNFDDYVAPKNCQTILEIFGGKLTKYKKINGEWHPE